MINVLHEAKSNKPQRCGEEPSFNIECKIVLVKLSGASGIRFSIFSLFLDNFRDILLLFHRYIFFLQRLCLEGQSYINILHRRGRHHFPFHVTS